MCVPLPEFYIYPQDPEIALTIFDGPITIKTWNQKESLKKQIVLIFILYQKWEEKKKPEK